MWGQQVLWYVIDMGLCPLVECYSYMKDPKELERRGIYICDRICENSPFGHTIFDPKF